MGLTLGDRSNGTRRICWDNLLPGYVGDNCFQGVSRLNSQATCCAGDSVALEYVFEDNHVTPVPSPVPTSAPTRSSTQMPTPVPTTLAPSPVPTSAPTQLSTQLPTPAPTTPVPWPVPTFTPTSAPTQLP